MSAAANPDIVTDGLVFKYDTGDGKSYRGEPTVNLVGSMTKKFTNWNGLTGSTEYYTTSEGNQGVKLITTSSGGVQWYSNSTIYNIQASTEYTISATVKYQGGTPHTNLLYVRQYDGNGQTSESGKFTTANERDLGGGWKRIWRTFTTDSTTTHINLQGYEYSSGRSIYIQDLQFELKSHATQFAGASTTRSDTQGLLDRTSNSTIDLSDVSFDSNAQMVFDGTDDYVTATIPSSTSLRCLETWFYNENAIPGNDTAIGGPTSYQTLYCFNDSYPMGVNLGGWTGSGTNEAIHIWSSPSAPWKFTYTRDAVPSGWHHLIFNWNGSTYDIWLDGQKQTVYASTGGHCDLISLSDLIIGNTSSPNYAFNGKNSITRIYNQSLTDAGIVQNFNATKSRFGL